MTQAKTKTLFSIPKVEQVFELHDRHFKAHGLKVDELPTIQKFREFDFTESPERVREYLEPVAEFLNGRRVDGDDEPVTAEWLVTEFSIGELGSIALELSKLPSDLKEQGNRQQRRGKGRAAN